MNEFSVGLRVASMVERKFGERAKEKGCDEWAYKSGGLEIRLANAYAQIIRLKRQIKELKNGRT